MASTFYDWHFARSQNRMKQQPLFDNGVQVDKYHHKEGLVLNFLAVVSAKQISILLDKQHTLELRDKILGYYPTDEVVRLRIGMTAIRHHAAQIIQYSGHSFSNEHITAILDVANSWPEMKLQADDLEVKDMEIARLKERIIDLENDLAHYVGNQ